MQIADALPDQTLALRETAARLYGRIPASLRELKQATPEAESTRWRATPALNNLGVCLSKLGRREDALAAAREAVDIYRRLAAERPDAFLPDLAMSLNNLGKFERTRPARGRARGGARRRSRSVAASPPSGPTRSCPISRCR